MSKEQSHNTFELDTCPNGGFHCHDLLESVNNLLHDANLFVENKEYNRALELKEKAFNRIAELEKERCQPCGALFREVILNSINTHVTDLKKMSSGLFGKKKYKYHFQNAQRLAKRMEDYLEKYNKSGATIQRMKKA